MTASEYRVALECTADIVQRRARQYRDLIVAVVLLGFGAIAAASLARSPRPLVALLLLLPACAAGYWRDARLLDSWRAELLTRWAAGPFDLTAFAAAVRANPALPRATVEGMLATLPDAGDLAAEQRVGTLTRRAVASASEAMHHGRTQTALLATVGSAFAAVMSLWAVVAGTWRPTFALAPLVLFPVVARWIRRRATATTARERAVRHGQPEFDETAYTRLVASVRA